MKFQNKYIFEMLSWLSVEMKWKQNCSFKIAYFQVHFCIKFAVFTRQQCELMGLTLKYPPHIWFTLWNRIHCRLQKNTVRDRINIHIRHMKDIYLRISILCAYIEASEDKPYYHFPSESKKSQMSGKISFWPQWENLLTIWQSHSCNLDMPLL